MADAVKITALPEVSALSSDDIIVLVDDSQTQTSQATLRQVQALGPGPETVTTPTIAPGAVTAPKSGYTAPNKIQVSSTTQTGDGVYIGEETDLTQYARTILSSPDAATAFARLGVSPTFTGPIRVPVGEPTAPTYTFVGDDNTGMFGGSQGYVNFASNGEVVFSIAVDREVYKRQADGIDALGQVVEGLTTPFIGLNAYAIFTPGSTAQTIDIQGSDAVGRFVGFSNYLASWPSRPTVWHGPTMRYDANTRAGIDTLLGTLGYQQSGSNNPPQYYTTRPGDGRTNYTSTGDNYHLLLDANGQNLYPTGYPAGSASPSGESAQWIARMIIYSAATNSTLIRRQNVSSVTNTYGATTNDYNESIPSNSAAGRYEIKFSVAFPDTNYSVIGCTHQGNKANSSFVTCLAKFRDRCIVKVQKHDNAAINADVNEIFVGVYR